MSESPQERANELKAQVQQQHRSLLAALRGLETMVEATLPAQGDLERRLNTLGDTFSAHIEEEEAGDLYQWAPAEFSAEKKELDQLRAQHQPIVDTVRELAVKTRSAENMETSSDLSIQIRSLIADIRQHEARESAVIARLT